MSEIFVAKTSLGFFDGCCFCLWRSYSLFRESNISTVQIQPPLLCFFFLCINTTLAGYIFGLPMEQLEYVNRRPRYLPRKV